MLHRSFNFISRKIRYTNPMNFSTTVHEQIVSVRKHNDKASVNNNFDKTNFSKLQELKHKQYFVKCDPDLFGNNSEATNNLVIKNDEDTGDVKEQHFLENPVDPSKKLSVKQYADIIKDLLIKRQIKEAIDVIQVRMIQQDKVKPDNYIYNLVIGGCGRVGYTKAAFKLFNDMKKRGLKPTNGTYTALFNACSNSPWIEDGLTRATNLRDLIKEKGVILNDTNYNSMIKAFGRCKDLKTAFSLVDEMIENKILVNGDTINFLLQSCISDQEVGFRHALLVWRKFYNKKCKPNIFSFNLMLRCIRDCNIGDVETMKNLLESPEFKLVKHNQASNTKFLLESPQNKRTPDSSDNDTTFEAVQNSEENCKLQLPGSLKNESSVSNMKHWPNLMAAKPYLGNVIQLKEITKPQDRLVLVGGCSGFLASMQLFEVKPDIKTFTQLLDCIPSTLSAETTLLSAMKIAKVRYDVDFLNMLMKRRVMRYDYENARDVVITLFKPPKYRPNIMTYGVLALSCETKPQAEELLSEMNEAGYRMNIQILGAMLTNACKKMNFVFILELMEITIRENIKPNAKFIEHLEKLYKAAKKESQNEKGNFFTKGFKLFRMRYKTWLQEVTMDTADEEHPWTQFREEIQTNLRHYKDKATHFKPRVTSRYRVKTGTLDKDKYKQ